MFSGIVETTSQIVAATSHGPIIRALVERPKDFNDLNKGDSIAVNGICLTVEEFSPEAIQFAIGPETQKVTGWTLSGVMGKVVNLERSLRLGDRIHGHLVTGHVDALGRITGLKRNGESQEMKIAFQDPIRPYVWPKGSIAINGVSLTINEAGADYFTVGLIPETLKRTNLGALTERDEVNLEVDNSARGLVHWLRNQEVSK
jgi:riboflavin synthase